MGINDGVGAVNGKCNLSTYYMYICMLVGKYESYARSESDKLS